MVVSPNRGPPYRPQNTIVHIIKTPKMVPLILGNPQREVSLNYCSQNGGNLYRAPYYTRNPNIGPRIDRDLGQSPYEGAVLLGGGE